MNFGESVLGALRLTYETSSGSDFPKIEIEKEMGPNHCQSRDLAEYSCAHTQSESPDGPVVRPYPTETVLLDSERS